MAEGAIVALLGANGAGKTTTLKAISSLVRPERGKVVQGGIRFRGESIVDADAAGLVRRGIVQVLEGRCFAHLTVEENILSGGFVNRPSRRALAADLERVYTWFPRLKVRRKQAAGLNSGGEQQMIAIGRALMTRPRLVLLDEPSMGLAPMLVEEIFEIVRGLNRQDGVSFLLAEQNTGFALRYADYAYVVETVRSRHTDRPRNWRVGPTLLICILVARHWRIDRRLTPNALQGDIKQTTRMETMTQIDRGWGGDPSQRYDELASRFRPLFQRIRAGAVERELARRLPLEEIRQLKHSGFGALRVPVADGGAGATLASHNPRIYKDRIVGDFAVNGTIPPPQWRIGLPESLAAQ